MTPIRPNCLVVGLLLAHAVTTADEAKKPAPKFPLGKDTTIVDGPLEADGYIDYEAALNARLGKGITPDKNAVVLLCKVFGPKPEGGKMPAEFYKALGVDEPPEKGDYLVGITRYVQDHAKLDKAEWNEVFDQQGRASQRPWAEKDYPHIAAWLKLNEKPLAVIREASKRTEYFYPLASSRSEKGRGGLIGALLPGVQKCREAAAALTARAMLRVHEGKFDEAWEDLIACHRLGRLVGRGATLIESLVGIALEAVASNAELAYLEQAQPTAKQARERLKDLQSLPPLPRMADKMDLGERFMFLDCMQLVRRGGLNELEGLAGGKSKKPDPKEEEALARIDWGVALRNGNKWYDRLADALRGKDRAVRQDSLKKIEIDLKALKANAVKTPNLEKLLAGLFGDAGKDVGESIGNVMIGLLFPAAAKVNDAADRAEAIHNNLQLAFALAAYQRDKGSFPAKLNDLAPAYLPVVPADVFSGKALVYKPAKGGYVLYSVGVNGKDDEGRWFDDEPAGDDPSVRMPLPALKARK